MTTQPGVGNSSHAQPLARILSNKTYIIGLKKQQTQMKYQKNSLLILAVIFSGAS